MEEEREAIAAANIISVASPLTLGLTTFAIATFLGGIVATGFYTPDSIGFLVPVGLFIGGLAQFLAGMWAFRKNDNFLATLFATYSAIWLSLSTIIIGAGIGAIILGAALMPMVGMFFIAAVIPMIYLCLASLRHSLLLTAITGLLSLALILLAIGSFTGFTPVFAAGGWVAIACGLVAFYTAAAYVVNDTFMAPVLPTWPTGVIGEDVYLR
jgi:succinate-acetate transporter protein